MKKVIQLLIIVLLSLVIFVIGICVYVAYDEYRAREEFVQTLFNVLE